MRSRRAFMSTVPPRPLFPTRRTLSLQRDVAFNALVFLFRNHMPGHQFVLSFIRTAGDHTFGGDIIYSGQFRELLFAGMIQVNTLVALQSFVDALRNRLSIALQIRGGLGRLFSQFVGVLVEQAMHPTLRAQANSIAVKLTIRTRLRCVFSPSWFSGERHRK